MVKKKFASGDNIMWYPNENFIPYACYVDKQTILTKDGSLLMTFKIPSFISNKSKEELFGIREALREVLAKILKIKIYRFILIL